MEIIGFLQAKSQVMSMDGHLTIRFNFFLKILPTKRHNNHPRLAFFRDPDRGLMMATYETYETDAVYDDMDLSPEKVMFMGYSLCT